MKHKVGVKLNPNKQSFCYHCTLIQSANCWQKGNLLSFVMNVPALKQTKCCRTVWIRVRGCSTKRKAEFFSGSSCLLTGTNISKDGTATHCRRHACCKEPSTISTFSWYWWSKEVCPCEEDTIVKSHHSIQGFVWNWLSQETFAGI